MPKERELDRFATEGPEKKEEDGGSCVADEGGSPDVDPICSRLFEEESSDHIEDAAGEWEEKMHRRIL